MKLQFTRLFIIGLLFVSGCETITTQPYAMHRVPTSVQFPQNQDKIKKNIVDVGYAVEDFVTMSNKSHPGNRIGYRFLEYKPIAYGPVPEKSEMKIETITANALQKQYARRPGVFVHTINITDQKGWDPQTWMYYIVPVADGFDLLWVIETKDKGLNEYYSVQQCFRLGGKSNRPWRRTIAEAPVFSEYELWDEQKSQGLPKTSLSFVRRNNKWQPVPTTEERIICRTPLGLQMDKARSGGNLTKMDNLKSSFTPRGSSSFDEDIDSGLVTRTTFEDDWVCALYWQNTTHISNHHPADCLHAFVNIGPLPPNSKRAIRGRIYWMKTSKDRLFTRWHKIWAAD